MIILEPVPELLLVFAGLAEVYADAGSIVPKGAPLGRMGSASPYLVADLRETFVWETLTGGGAPPPETIYIDVRRDGRPTDPADFFATDQAANRDTR